MALRRCATQRRNCERTLTFAARSQVRGSGGDIQTRLDLSFERGREGGALQAGDRRGRRDLLRATLGAAHVGVAGVTPRITRYRCETLCSRSIAHVVHE